MPNYCSIHEIIQMQKSFAYLQNQAKRDLFGNAVKLKKLLAKMCVTFQLTEEIHKETVNSRK